MVVSYQYGSPDAFCCRSSSVSINTPYVDGISITHGSPRQHIFTYAAGYSAKPSSASLQYVCPCNTGGTGHAPPAFVGNDYYCESGNPKPTLEKKLYINDPLWDGMTCTGDEPPCCTPNSKLPYFHYKVCGQSTSDVIELRLCYDENFPNEEIPIAGYRLYIR